MNSDKNVVQKGEGKKSAIERIQNMFNFTSSNNKKKVVLLYLKLKNLL